MLTEIILGGAVLLLLLWMVCGRPSGLPPGRWGLPLIGYIPLNGKYIDDILMDLHKQYGDIYIWRIGTTLQVYVHDYSVCRQVFASSDFLDRQIIEALKNDSGVTLGVALSNGDIWSNNRRFSLRQLRDLGMGKSGLVSAVQEQALIVIDALKESAGKAGPVTPALHMAIINVIWKMIANRVFETSNSEQMNLQKMMTTINEVFSSTALLDTMPWTRKVIPKFILRRLFRMDAMDAALNDFSVYFKRVVKEHRASLDPDDPKDLIDAYLLEMEEEKKKGGTPERMRSEDDLQSLCFDMFFAGSDSTNSTMKWIFLYMAAFPDVQRKLQQEIDEVLPKGTMATLEDKPRLPYTEAVTNEVIRKSSLSNIGFHHSASRDTMVAGYKIPKGTLVTSTTAAIHHDPRYWEKPEHFLPQRWLNSEGNFVMKKEGYLPFGSGKRGCIGEGLARMEILVFTTAVFQNFNVAPPEGKLVDLLPYYENPISHDPRKQDLVFTLRD